MSQILVLYIRNRMITLQYLQASIQYHIAIYVHAFKKILA